MTSTPTLWGATAQVNPSSIGFQGQHKIIGLSNGNHLVVFADDSDTVGTGLSRDIVGVIYGPSGVVVRAPFQVNIDFAIRDEEMPAIAADNTGGFYMAYEDRDSSGQAIRIERYDDNGDRVSGGVTTIQSDPGVPVVSAPSIEVAASGSVVVSYTWSEGAASSARAKLLDANLNFIEQGPGDNGVVLRADGFPVDVILGVDTPETVALTDGNFVTVYTEPDTDVGIEFRGNNGTTGAATFHTNVGATGENGVVDFDPHIAALTGGGFVLVWVEDEADDDNILFAIYNNSGQQVVAPTVVVDSGFNHRAPDVVALQDGGFFVAARDSDQNRIEGRRYDAAGIPVGIDVFTLVDTNSPDGPELALTSDGRILLSWTDSSGNILKEIWDPRDTTITADGTEGVLTARATDDTTIIGSANGETILGGPGDDTIQGGAGADDMDGGGGTNTLSYATSVNGVVLRLDNGLAASVFFGSDAAGDIFSNFQNVIGSADGDEINGDAVDNLVDGGEGNDLLRDYEGGADTLRGGDGDDRIEITVPVNTVGAIYNGGAEATLGDELRVRFEAPGPSVVDLTDDLVVGFEHFSVTELSAAGPLATVRFTDAQIAQFDSVGNFALSLDLTIAVAMQGTALDLSGTVISGLTQPFRFEVTGTGTGDSITGSTTGDVILGGSGNDSMAGGDGEDSLYGGSGVDSILGGAGDDYIAGGTTFKDTLWGGDGDDTLEAVGGGLIEGNADNDTFIVNDNFFISDLDPTDGDLFDGGSGTDVFDASNETSIAVTIDLLAQTVFEGGDELSTVALVNFENATGSQVGDTIIGDNFANDLKGEGGDDTLIGGDGDDTLTGGMGVDSIEGGDGDDRIIIGNGDEIDDVDGGSNTDTLDASAEDGTAISVTAMTLVGTWTGTGGTRGISRIEHLIGTQLGDTLNSGNINNVTIEGGDGDDTINGGGGNQTLIGGDGDDVIDGGFAAGSAVSDDLSGGIGNDAITGANGADTIDGGADNDTITANGGADTILGGSGRDSIVSGDGDDTVEGGLGNDTIFGDAGSDSLSGDADVDLIFGGGGADSLEGGTDTDVLIGETRGIYHTDISAQVFRMYAAALGREPDINGHQGWAQLLSGGAITLDGMAAAFVNSPEFQNTYGSLDNTQFVTLLYDNVLDRVPGASGLNFWVGELTSGASRAEVVRRFAESGEHVTRTTPDQQAFDAARDPTEWVDDVYRLFRAVFDREPDGGGFTFWVESLSTGRFTFEAAVNLFMASPEFQTTYGATSNAVFVGLLYENVLDRPGNASGVTFWTDRLDGGMSREVVVQLFMASPEFVNGTEADVRTYIAGYGPDDVIDPGAGDAVVSGGLYADTFVFTDDAVASTVTVTDLEVFDTLRFSGFGLSAAQIRGQMAQDGGDVVLVDGSETIVFANTALADITEAMITIA